MRGSYTHNKGVTTRFTTLSQNANRMPATFTHFLRARDESNEWVEIEEKGEKHLYLKGVPFISMGARN